MGRKKKLKGIMLSQKEMYLLGAVLAVMIIAVVLTAIFLTPYLAFISFWVFSIFFFVAMRLPNSWKIGLEVFFLFTFFYSYIFGAVFTISVILFAWIIVFKRRPDEGQGLVAHFIVLMGMIVTARIFLYIYGIGISSGELLFASLFSLALWLIADTLLAPRIAPVPIPKLIVNHSLEFLIGYIVATTWGYEIFKFLISIKP
ncbi:MAG: hypothetical protein ABIG20_00550 [archaeon]